MSLPWIPGRLTYLCRKPLHRTLTSTGRAYRSLNSSRRTAEVHNTGLYKGALSPYDFVTASRYYSIRYISNLEHTEPTTRFYCPVMRASESVTGLPGCSGRRRPESGVQNTGKTLKEPSRETADEARMLSINVLFRARDLRRNWLRHILRMQAGRTVRQVFLNCA